jgi:hypothetical protein
MKGTSKLVALAKNENILMVFPDGYKKNGTNAERWLLQQPMLKI